MPAFHIGVLGFISWLHSNSSFLLMYILGRQEWWLKALSPCCPQGRPGSTFQLLTHGPGLTTLAFWGWIRGLELPILCVCVYVTQVKMQIGKQLLIFLSLAFMLCSQALTSIFLGSPTPFSSRSKPESTPLFRILVLLPWICQAPLCLHCASSVPSPSSSLQLTASQVLQPGTQWFP